MISKITSFIKLGDAADGMYFIEEGTVSIKMLQDGGEKEISKLEKGQYFGELALVTHKPRAASAYAQSGNVKVACKLYLKIKKKKQPIIIIIIICCIFVIDIVKLLTFINDKFIYGFFLFLSSIFYISWNNCTHNTQLLMLKHLNVYSVHAWIS